MVFIEGVNSYQVTIRLISMEAHTQKILILMCHGLGVTFWSMLASTDIKKKYPDSEIWIGVKSQSKDLFFGLIDYDKTLELNNVIGDRHREKFLFKEYLSELRRVRREKFNIAIDLTGNRYSALFLFLCGIKKRIGLNLHKLSFLYTMKGPKFDFSTHLINKSIQTVNILFKCSRNNEQVLPEIAITDEALCSNIGITKETLSTEKIALLVPGAGWQEKCWDLNSFAECGNFLTNKGYKIIISGSPAEKALCVELSSMITNSITFNSNLKYFIALISYIDLAISNDNGAGHLIAASDKKLISIFCGNTDPRICGPIGRNVIIVEKENTTPKNVIPIIDVMINTNAAK